MMIQTRGWSNQINEGKGGGRRWEGGATRGAAWGQGGIVTDNMALEEVLLLLRLHVHQSHVVNSGCIYCRKGTAWQVIG